MAIVRSNDLIEGLSGMFGDTMVFRNLRGKTVVSQRPKLPKKESEQQKTNRSKFRQATAWAQSVLEDPKRKEYYQKKARKLNLPNAYTAAITDYMRSPVVSKHERNDVTVINVRKKDFSLKRVEVELPDSTSTDEVRAQHFVSKNGSEDWMIEVSTSLLQGGAMIYVTDGANRSMRFDVS